MKRNMLKWLLLPVASVVLNVSVDNVLDSKLVAQEYDEKKKNSISVKSPATITKYSPNEMIVKFNRNTQSLRKISGTSTGIAAVDVLNKWYKLKDISQLLKETPNTKRNFRELGLDAIYIMRFESGNDISDLVDQYMKTGAFESVTPSTMSKASAYKHSANGTVSRGGMRKANYTPDDEHLKNQWAINNDGINPVVHPGKVGADMDVFKAWDITKGDSSIVVALVSSGTKLNHPEFVGRAYVNQDEIPANQIDDDNNGYIDDINGWNFSAGKSNNDIRDFEGMGTSVAGVLVAKGNNSIGFAGVDLNCKFMTLKVFENWYAQDTDIIKAFTYAVENGADIIYTPAITDQQTAGYHDVVKYAYQNNIPVIVPMGDDNTTILVYPAAWPETVAVGATDNHDVRTGWSNQGDHIDFVAPGEWIYALNHQSDTRFDEFWWGTGFSAIHATAAWSLMKAVDSTKTIEEYRDILHKTADDIRTFQANIPNRWWGYGRINIGNALDILTSVKEKEPIPSEFLLYQNFPNPFNPSTTIKFSLPNNEKVSIEVFNLLGQKVATVLAEQIPVGSHEVRLNAQELPSGIYVYKLTAGDFVAKKKCLLIK